MTDLSNMPLVAITRGGTTHTTMAKVLSGLTGQEATKRTAPKCASCGQYSTHENLTAVNTDDGVARICPTCLNDRVNDGSGKTWKQLHKSQWEDAAEQMDEIVAKWHRLYPELPTDALAKSEALAQARGRLEKGFDNAMAYFRRMAVPPGRKSADDRVTSLVKAEMTRRQTAELVAKTKRTKRKVAKMRRQADAMELAKREAEQMLADLLTTQAAATAQLDDIARRVDVVYTNAQRAFGGVAQQREAQAIAERARQDQRRADWTFKASQTSDPILKRAYLDRAAGHADDN
jgi:hypothetical protein